MDLGEMSAHLGSLAMSEKTAAKEQNRRAMLTGIMVADCGRAIGSLYIGWRYDIPSGRCSTYSRLSK